MAKFYVATAIPYVNDVPHVGHAMEAIQSDLLARYHRQLGDDVFYSAGTDEHGGKILEQATKSGAAPEQFVAQLAEVFQGLHKALQSEYTKFVRTSDPDHVRRSQAIWTKLAPDLYKGKYVGMYDQKEESFVTDEEAREIEANDPTRFARLQKVEEENYFFRLSKYSDQIKAAIEANELVIVPESRRKEFLNVLKDGLNDISVSRPKEKLPWGVPVPGDEGHVIYVWFEALMNYITTIGYPDKDEYQAWWPTDVHVIGKDIIRFHAGIWPGMLMSLGLPLPKTVFVHGFVTMDGQKMSKSVGNVVAPHEIIDTYGSDAMRYFFLRHIPSSEDGDFTWAKFEAAYNGELGNDLGNLVQRTAMMVQKYQEGVVGDIPDSPHDIKPYHEAMQAFRFDRALEYVWSLLRGLNQYIDEQKPWELAKQNDPERLQEVLAYIVSSLLQAADLLEPFLPSTSAAIIRIFGEGTVKHDGTPLFPRIQEHTGE